MIAAHSTAVAYSLAAYLATTEIVDATTFVASREPPKVVETHVRSWAGSAGYKSVTAGSDEAVLVMDSERVEAGLIASIVEFLDLSADWDGEGAAQPKIEAVVDAVTFISAAGHLSNRLEPTLHVDGSIILELDDGSAGSLRFRGDRTVVYAFEGTLPGVVPFDGYTVPREISAALRA